MNKTCQLSAILLLSSICMSTFAVEENIYRGFGNTFIQFPDFKTLKQKGLISNKPTISRADYNDVYQFKKQYQFLGQNFVLLFDEYMLEYAGCCVNEGWGAVFAKHSDLKQIQQFAQKNQCKVEKMNLDSKYYYGYEVKKLPKNKEYYELSCRADDLE